MKSNVASVDHLKEIDRLRSMLAAAENNARTLSAQLNTKEHGKRGTVAVMVCDLCCVVVGCEVWVEHCCCPLCEHVVRVV